MANNACTLVCCSEAVREAHYLDSSSASQREQIPIILQIFFLKIDEVTIKCTVLESGSMQQFACTHTQLNTSSFEVLTTYACASARMQFQKPNMSVLRAPNFPKDDRVAAPKFRSYQHSKSRTDCKSRVGGEAIAAAHMQRVLLEVAFGVMD